MVRDEVLSQLKAYSARLKAEGVQSLSLFGSVARGDEHADSDIDLLASLDNRDFKLSLLDIARLQDELERVLGRRVQITTTPLRNPYFKKNVEQDLIRVY